MPNPSIAILIPTLKRQAALDRVLASVDVSVATPVVGYEAEPRGYVAAMNALIAKADADILICANDDIEFAPGAIETAAATLLSAFPDGDGMTHMHQIGRVRTTPEPMFPVVGLKFANRFPCRQMFCPDYIHFWSDIELGRFVREAGLWKASLDAGIYHRREEDEIRGIGETFRAHDAAMNQRRRRHGLMWGKNFRLIKQLYRRVA